MKLNYLTIAGILTLLSILSIGYYSIFIALTANEAQKYIIGFIIGFIGGINWILIIILDPKSRYYYKKQEETIKNLSHENETYNDTVLRLCAEDDLLIQYLILNRDRNWLIDKLKIIDPTVGSKAVSK